VGVLLEMVPWWVYAIICGAIFIAVIDSFINWPVGRRRAALRDAVSMEQNRRARRASWRGPVPIDPETRQEAYWLAVRTLEQNATGRVYSLIYFVVAGVAALTTSAWCWLFAAIFASKAGFSLWLSRRLDRRIEDLRADGDDTGGTDPPDSTPH
jgi:hypothetical protein